MKDLIELLDDKNYIVKLERANKDNIVVVTIPENVLRLPKEDEKLIGYEIIEDTLIKRKANNTSSLLKFNNNSITHVAPKYAVRLAFMFDLMFELNKAGINTELIKKYKDGKLVSSSIVDMFDRPSDENWEKEDILTIAVDSLTGTAQPKVPVEIEDGYNNLVGIIRKRGIQ